MNLVPFSTEMSDHWNSARSRILKGGPEPKTSCHLVCPFLHRVAPIPYLCSQTLMRFSRKTSWFCWQSLLTLQLHYLGLACCQKDMSPQFEHAQTPVFLRCFAKHADKLTYWTGNWNTCCWKYWQTSKTSISRMGGGESMQWKWKLVLALVDTRPVTTYRPVTNVGRGLQLPNLRQLLGIHTQLDQLTTFW